MAGIGLLHRVNGQKPYGVDAEFIEPGIAHDLPLQLPGWPNAGDFLPFYTDSYSFSIEEKTRINWIMTTRI
jgi:hypothetical protein